MPADLVWYESDGVTPWATQNVGILKPGEDYITKFAGPFEMILKNDGDAAANSVTVEIVQVGSGAAWTLVEIAQGASPAYPGDYVDKDGDPLVIGTLGIAATVKISAQITVPGGQPEEVPASYILRADHA